MATQRATVAAAILLIVAACDAPGSRENTGQTSRSAQQSATPVPGPVDVFVKAHAPKAEVRLINSAEQFATGLDAGSGRTETDINSRMAESWRDSVLDAINFTGWVAYVDRADQTGRIYLKIANNMFLWTDIPKDSPLLVTFLNVRPHHQAVYISGKIANDDAAGLKGAIDSKSPTCFEAASGPQGCHVELTDLRPLAVVD
jgi:hypothetical protein